MHTIQIIIDIPKGIFNNWICFCNFCAEVDPINESNEQTNQNIHGTYIKILRNLLVSQINTWNDTSKTISNNKYLILTSYNKKLS